MAIFDLKEATILIIDDQPDNLRLVAGFLESYGADVMLGHSGPDGIAKARLGRPDLILLDIMMPGMDGFEVCAELKADSSTTDIPVIFLSALGEMEDKLSAFEAGGVDYLIKPLQEMEVVARVDVHLRLRRALQQAKTASLAKTAFLASMNHEIRTPLNSILGYVSLLQDKLNDAEGREQLNAIQAAGNALLQLIEDVLDLSRMESDRLVLQPAPLDLGALMREMELMFGPKATHKGVEFSLRCEAVPPVLMLDEMRMRQILVNLIANAVKFTHAGEISVAVEARSGGEKTVRLQFVVRDTGIGIPADQQQLIFQPFVQRKGQNASVYGGTGLGLAICASLVEQMGGRIFLDSSPRQGSCFRVVLPSVEVGQARLSGAEQPPQRLEFEPAKLLVVDDEPGNRLLLNHLVKALGMTVLEAGDGRQAVAMTRRDRPDLVLMDVSMPVMDGEEAVGILKADEQTRDIPVLAITALSRDECERLRESPFDEVLRKPVTRDILSKALRDYLPSHQVEKNHQVPDLAGPEFDESADIILPEPLWLRWLEVSREPSINDVEALGQALLERGERIRDQGLCRWGRRLLDAAEHFDPVLIDRAIKQLGLVLRGPEAETRQ